jgi:hypothetical protein
VIRVGQLVRTRGPLTVWVLSESVLSGEYLVEKVRGGDVRVAGVWVPAAFVEVVR